MGLLRSVVTLCAPLLALTFVTSAHAASSRAREDMTACAVRIRYERIEGGSLITGHGTAFGVDLSSYGVKSRRLLLSAAHNVLDEKGRPYATLKIEINEGTRTYWSKCKVLASEEGLDICLIESGDELPVLAELDTCDLQPGTAIILAGSPRGVPVSLFDGEVIRRFDNGTIRSAARLPFDHGDSGGPMFNPSAGKVVGIAVAGVPKDGDLDHNIGLFVPLVAVDSFLQTNLKAKRAQPLIVAERTAPKPHGQKSNAETAFVDPATVKPKAVEPARAVAAVAATEEKPRVIAASSATHMAEMAEIVPTPDIKPQPVEKKVAAAPTTIPASQTVERAKLPAPTLEMKPAPTLEEVHSNVVNEAATAVYVVQAGDSLSRIARQHNVAMNDLIAANGIKDPNLIYIGMKMTIPRHAVNSK